MGKIDIQVQLDSIKYSFLKATLIVITIIHAFLNELIYLGKTSSACYDFFHCTNEMGSIFLQRPKNYFLS